MIYKAWFLVALLVSVSGCATTKVCPTASEEAVSMCRAEAACKSNFGQRFQAGQSGTMHLLRANESLCVSNHIEAQKSNAALKLMGSN
jgi:hypothetical protein